MGSLPASLKNLTNLQSLELGLNQLSGALPRELGALSRLVFLDLPFNRLTGGLPADLGNLATSSSSTSGATSSRGASPRNWATCGR